MNRHRVAVTLAVLTLFAAGCAFIQISVDKFSAGPIEVTGFRFIFNSLSPEQQAQVKIAACKICRAILEIRDTYRALSSLPEPVGSLNARIADVYDQQLAACLRAKETLGPCPPR